MTSEFNSAETLNIPYARKVLEHLQAHPEEHAQSLWGYRSACGTKACIAGTAVLMDSETTVLWSSMGDLAGRVSVNNRYMDIEQRAAQLLGLKQPDKYDLFNNENNGGALKQLADYLAEAEKVQHA